MAKFPPIEFVALDGDLEGTLEAIRNTPLIVNVADVGYLVEKYRKLEIEGAEAPRQDKQAG